MPNRPRAQLRRAVRLLRVWRLATRRGLHWCWIKVRGHAADDARRAALEQRFAIRTAEDVARELGQMKGALMKAGQLVSFIAEGLPDEAKAVLAQLQADAPPMSPGLARQVVIDDLGADPERLFLEWSEVPVAAASIGQVHRAVLWDGREVAVKVQYPGVGEAIRHDLDHAEVLYRMLSAVALPSLDPKGLVDELRARMVEELDYRLEASRQAEFAARYEGHPFVRIPAVVPERSGARVLTSEWIDGLPFAEFEASASAEARERAAEVVFRFVQGSVYGARVFNGDPHPGNYRFHRDGSVTFLDFGLVKRWAPGELEALVPVIDPLLDGDAPLTVAKMVEVGFLEADHGLDAQLVWDYVSTPYRPYLSPTFTFSRQFTKDALGTVIDVKGPYESVIRSLDMPASFVILDRVVWGVSALLGRLGATNRWRAILDEYRVGSAPATEMGRAEAEWRAGRPGVGAPGAAQEKVGEET